MVRIALGPEVVLLRAHLVGEDAQAADLFRDHNNGCLCHLQGVKRIVR